MEGEKNMKKRILTVLLVAVMAVSVVAFAACTPSYEEATGVSYFVAHQGGYVGEAIVKIDGAGKVISAELNEYLGPTDWAKGSNSAPADGTIIRFPYVNNNPSSTSGIKDYILFQYSTEAGSRSNWSEYTYNGTSWSRGGQIARDFEGRMGNPRLAEAYVKSIKNNTLEVVTVNGATVTAGQKASALAALTSYKVMNKAESTSGYMPIGAATIGYRENLARTLAFFIANPTADFGSAVTAKEAANFDNETYTATEDDIFQVGGASTGATWTDYIHYSLELQNAYNFALATQRA